jgi:hypothetical protein
VTFPPISQQVSLWVGRLTTISRNLMALSETESTKIIRARLKDTVNGYSGITRERAIRAVEILDELLQQYSLLAHVIDEASGLVGKGGLFRNNEGRIRDLLQGQSVVLVTQHVSVNNRGLLDNETKVVRATPSEVLADMEKSFAETRDVFSSIANAIAQVRPRLTGLGQEVTRLDNWARTLGVTNSTSLPDISKMISHVENDPLGCTIEVDQIESSIVRWRNELQAIDTERKTILVSIERGKASLAQLRDLIARSGAAYAEAREKIANPQGLVPPNADADVESLETWLRTLEQNVEAGRFAAVKVGMAKWEQGCRDRLDVERTRYSQNRAGLDERDELRGRFNALRAMADTLRSRGLVLGEAAESLSQQAKIVLDAIPFDISTGRRLVAEFESIVSSARK